MKKLAVVILAAGQGTRMASNLPKVLHQVAGLPMLFHVINTAKALKPEKIIVVTSPDMEQAQRETAKFAPDVIFAIQKEQLGTSHALLSAAAALTKFDGNVVCLYGDCPLVRPETPAKLLEKLNKSKLALVAMQAANPSGYGRVVTDKKGKVSHIIEEKDANLEQKSIRACFTGIMGGDWKVVQTLLSRVQNKNTSGEYYLPDIFKIAYSEGISADHIIIDEEEAAGVNSRRQLAEVEAIFQRRARLKFLDQSVTMLAPETVYFSHDTAIGKDTVIHPNVVFGVGVKIGERVTIKSFSYLEGASVGAGSAIGPFARLRPGTELGEEVLIGNFVEVKKSRFGKGSKASHLTYIGDSVVGKGANIGAGTITCNYDGFNKHETHIGDDSFIGSNTALVAPVKVGKGAVVGAGSVITSDVPDDALALSRAEQQVRPGWAYVYRKKNRKKP